MPAQSKEPWQELFDAVGGRHKLATICDVSESTVWRWSRFKFRPAQPTVDLVNRLCKKNGIDPVFTEQ